MIKPLFGLLCLVPLASCFLGETSVNEPLDFEAARSLRPGATAAQVVEKMGAPDEIVQLGRRFAYRYSYRVDKGTGAWFILLGMYNEDTRSDLVWFFFDEQQVLTHTGSTFHSHRASFGLSPSYDEETNRAADAERGLRR